MYHPHHQQHNPGQHDGIIKSNNGNINMRCASSRPDSVHGNLFLPGQIGRNDSGLVLSTDAKPRLKWTSDLHHRFIEAVNQLGGPDKATPKTVMKIMGIPGLTLYHLKSHLQKYRLSKNLHGQATNSSCGTPKFVMAGERLPDHQANDQTCINNLNTIAPHMNKSLHISEALEMQIEVQRRLHEQLEVQRHLQLRIEAQGKYLQAVLEKAQETLGKQGSSSSGAVVLGSLEATKLQLSELVSKVSNQCLQLGSTANTGITTSAAFPDHHHHLKQIQAGFNFSHEDGSGDSCLTSCEERRIMSSELSININNNGGLVQTGGDREGIKVMSKNRVDTDHRQGRLTRLENDDQNSMLRMPYFAATALDLNVDDENNNIDIGSNSGCNQFDLNGIGWS